MNEDVLVKVEGVSKKFCRSLKRSMLYGLQDIARDTFGLPSATEELRKDEFWSVQDISFEVKRGECLGIIGPNGAGKSTLLKMLNGIILPDKGKITVRGRVGALIEVGAGFHPMLTGRENIYINGSVLGLSKKEIDAKFDEIVAFAELEDFIDSPIKTYSSGMFVRLGFAVAAHVQPDILLLDEVLAVGDMAFVAKCFQHISSTKKTTAIILVSHDMRHISRMCDYAIYLRKGINFFFGLTDNTISRFRRDTHTINTSQNVYNSDNVIIVSITSERQNDIFKQHEDIRIKIQININSVNLRPIINIAIHRNDGIHCCGLLSPNDILPYPSLGEYLVCFTMHHASLMPGQYYISVYILDHDKTALLAFQENALLLTILGIEDTYGIFYPQHYWSIKEIDTTEFFHSRCS